MAGRQEADTNAQPATCVHRLACFIVGIMKPPLHARPGCRSRFGISRLFQQARDVVIDGRKDALLGVPVEIRFLSPRRHAVSRPTREGTHES